MVLEKNIFEVFLIIISLRELYVAIAIRAPIQSAKMTYAAFPPSIPDDALHNLIRIGQQHDFRDVHI